MQILVDGSVSTGPTDDQNEVSWAWDNTNVAGRKRFDEIN